MTDLEAKYITLSRYIPATARQIELWQEEASKVMVYIRDFNTTNGTALDYHFLHFRLSLALSKVKALTGFQ